MLVIKRSKSGNKVEFIKDWSTSKIGTLYDPTISKKLMESVSACNVQTVFLSDVSNRCFSRIRNTAIVKSKRNG